MMISTASPNLLSSTPELAYGALEHCGEEDHPDIRHRDDSGLIDTSIAYQVDDSHAPDYFLAKVTYGFYYKADGWKHNSYQLKLQPTAEGGLRYDLVEGDSRNLVSSDDQARASAQVRCKNSFRLYFLCTAIGPKSPKGNTGFSQSHASLCLKTG